MYSIFGCSTNNVLTFISFIFLCISSFYFHPTIFTKLVVNFSSVFQFDRKMKDGNVKEKKFLLFFKKLIHKQQTHILAKEFPAILQKNAFIGRNLINFTKYVKDR